MEDNILSWTNNTLSLSVLNEKKKLLKSPNDNLNKGFIV